jgi:hypothetical protein
LEQINQPYLKKASEIQRPIIRNGKHRNPDRLFATYSSQDKLYIGEIDHSVKMKKKKYVDPNFQ